MRITNIVQNLLQGIRDTATEQDRAEAEELLRRLNTPDRPAPRFATAQKPAKKKGGRK